MKCAGCLRKASRRRAAAENWRRFVDGMRCQGCSYVADKEVAKGSALKPPKRLPDQPAEPTN